MPPARMTVPPAPIPRPSNPRGHAPRSPSCWSRRVTAPRSPAAPPARCRTVGGSTRARVRPLFDTTHSSSADSPIPAAAGIGLRFPHHQQVLETKPPAAWFEVHSENFFGGGTVRQTLLNIRHHYPISLHGVGLSLGSAEG